MRSLISEIGLQVLFLNDLIRATRKPGITSAAIFSQIEKVIIQSLVIVAVCGFFVGAILVIQFTSQLEDFGAMAYLGGLVTSSTVREIGPLLIAFMLSGKIGAFTAAEVGTMKVTEQVDAIRCLGADPLQVVIVPRFIGIVVGSFFLLAIGIFMSVFGGLTLSILVSGISAEQYLRHISTLVTMPSIFSGLFKCLVFAFTLATVCTYKGYNTKGGARGVGQAVVQTAVMTMIGIVITDWLTTQIFDSLMLVWEGW